MEPVGVLYTLRSRFDETNSLAIVEGYPLIVAALGDIHGNWPAFEAVISQIDDEGIQTVVNTGDCVVGHPWPNEVLGCLRDRGIVTVQGEFDRQVARFVVRKRSLQERHDAEEFAEIEGAYRCCSSANIEFLQSLPRQRESSVDGVHIVVCHGTLASQAESLTDGDSDDCFLRQREIVPADIIILGRTHISHSRLVGGTLFVNPGSVGVADGEEPRAGYAVISTESEPWEVEQRWVEYNPGQQPSR